MNEPGDRRFGRDLPVPLLHEVDRVADKFAADLRSGKQVCIEDRLERVPVSARQAALFELLVEEIGFHGPTELASRGEDYRKRFPDQPEVVNAAMQHAEQTSVESTGGPQLMDVDLDQTLSYCVSTPDGVVRPVLDASQHRQLRRAFAIGGKVQDRYLLEQEIGSGGFGQVYLAKDLRLDRHVAVKVILPQLSSADCTEYLEREFVREARMGADLNHSAIATVFDFGMHRGKPFTVFEYADGETLREVLRRRTRLPLEEVRAITGPLAQALDFAHGRGIVHRDLKPENIKSTRSGQYKILDLGLAKEFRKVSDWRGFAGTPAYASPEQADQLPTDGRADQYALALIVYEMLAGRRVFEHTTLQGMLELHRSQPPLSLEPGVPHSVNAAIMRALEKAPSNRFDYCSDFAVALGCQIIREPIESMTVMSQSWATPSVLHIGTTSYVPPIWLLFKALRTTLGVLARFEAFGFLRSYLLLGQTSLWIVHAGEAKRYPLKGMKVTANAWRLHIQPEGHLEESYVMEKMPPESWVTRISAQQRRSSQEAPVSTENKQLPPLLTRSPSVRYQVLSSAEAESNLRWRAKVALQARAAMLDADAVTDVQYERVAAPTERFWRASGNVVRAVDEAGHRAFRIRQASEITKMLATLMLSAVLFGMAATAFGPPPHYEDLPAVASAQVFLPTLLLILLLRVFRVSQLLRVTAVVGVAASVSVMISYLSFTISTTSFSKGQLWGFILGAVPKFLWIAVAILLAGKAWRISKSWRSEDSCNLDSRRFRFLELAFLLGGLSYATFLVLYAPLANYKIALERRQEQIEEEERRQKMLFGQTEDNKEAHSPRRLKMLLHRIEKIDANKVSGPEEKRKLRKQLLERRQQIDIGYKSRSDEKLKAEVLRCIDRLLGELGSIDTGS